MMLWTKTTWRGDWFPDTELKKTAPAWETRADRDRQRWSASVGLPELPELRVTWGSQHKQQSHRVIRNKSDRNETACLYQSPSTWIHPVTVWFSLLSNRTLPIMQRPQEVTEYYTETTPKALLHRLLQVQTSSVLLYLRQWSLLGAGYDLMLFLEPFKLWALAQAAPQIARVQQGPIRALPKPSGIRWTKTNNTKVFQKQWRVVKEGSRLVCVNIKWHFL